MRVSVITVCLNSEKTIKSCLKSIKSQTYADIQCVVIDGGSTDKTLEIAKSVLCSGDVLISEEDYGLFDAMNKGLGIAEGELVTFLNSDDRFISRDVIALACSSFKPETVACAGGVVFVDSLANLGVTRLWRAPSFSWLGFKFGWRPPHPGLFFRREDAPQAPKFNLAYSIAADFDFILGLLNNKSASEFVMLDRFFVYMSVGGVSDSGFFSFFSQNTQDAQIYLKYFPKKFLIGFYLGKILIRVTQVLDAKIGSGYHGRGKDDSIQ